VIRPDHAHDGLLRDLKVTVSSEQESAAVYQTAVTTLR